MFAEVEAVWSAATVAQSGGPTAVRAYGGTIVFSAFNETEHRWYLSVRMAAALAAQH